MNLRTNILGIAALFALCCALGTSVYYAGAQTMLVYASWGFAGFMLAAWVGLNHESLLAFLTRRSTRYGANLGLVVFLVLGIMVFLNILGKEYSWRKDISRTGINTFSPQTFKVLAELPVEVKAQLFTKMQAKERSEALLKNYAYQSPKFKYEFVDMDRQPTLTTSMGVKVVDTVILSLPDGKRVNLDSPTEEKVTNGLIKLLRQKDQTLYFVIGHGEHAPDNDGDPQGFGLFRGELEKQGYTVKELNLLNDGAVPPSAAVLIVGGPKSGFFPKELEILGDWIRKGGRALLAVDLDINASGLAKGSEQLAGLVRPYGIKVMSQMLVDPTSRVANVEPQVLLGFSGSREHVVTRDFANSANVANFLFPLTTHLQLEARSDVSVTPLAVTSAQAWAESDWASLKSGRVTLDKTKDTQARMNLAVAVEKAAPQPEKGKEPPPPENGYRLAVFANSIFATNSMIDKVGNRDFLLNAVAWLASDERFISIRATEDQDGLKQYSNSVLNLILLFTVILVPVLTTAAGVGVWWRRSKL